MPKQAKMKAKTRFLFKGVMLNKDDTFSVSETYASEYENNNLAVRMDKEQKTLEAQEVKSSEEKVLFDYENMTVKELKALAKAQNIEGYTNMKKDELIQALKGAI